MSVLDDDRKDVLDETFGEGTLVDFVPTHLEIKGCMVWVGMYAPGRIVEIAADRRSALVRIWHLMRDDVWVSAWALRHYDGEPRALRHYDENRGSQFTRRFMGDRR